MLASIGANDVNGPDVSAETAHASAPIASSVRSTSRENDSERPVMIRPIANTSATPTTAITKRFHRHCKSRSAASQLGCPLCSQRGTQGRWRGTARRMACAAAIRVSSCFARRRCRPSPATMRGRCPRRSPDRSYGDHGPAVGGEAPAVIVDVLGNGSPICARASRSYSRTAPFGAADGQDATIGREVARVHASTPSAVERAPCGSRRRRTGRRRSPSRRAQRRGCPARRPSTLAWTIGSVPRSAAVIEPLASGAPTCFPSSKRSRRVVP